MSVFRFKQFDVDQTGCAMKVNTDGVLLGAITDAANAQRVLDIGTGTGVIALMLVQRFLNLSVDAVELDEAASRTATANFAGSSFADRLHIYHQSFQDHFKENAAEKYDLMVSNPPFYINSLHSPGATRKLAKHADNDFFEQLITLCPQHLTHEGQLWLVLPIDTAAHVKRLLKDSKLNVRQVVNIRSFPHSDPHREVLCLGFTNGEIAMSDLAIYAEPKVYTDAYRRLLKEFLTIF